MSNQETVAGVGVIVGAFTSEDAAGEASGIVIPFPTGNMNLQFEPETVGQFSRAFKNSDQTGSTVE
jgi:hypothetical protein